MVFYQCYGQSSVFLEQVNQALCFYFISISIYQSIYYFIYFIFYSLDKSILGKTGSLGPA